MFSRGADPITKMYFPENNDEHRPKYDKSLSDKTHDQLVEYVINRYGVSKKEAERVVRSHPAPMLSCIRFVDNARKKWFDARGEAMDGSLA